MTEKLAPAEAKSEHVQVKAWMVLETELPEDSGSVRVNYHVDLADQAHVEVHVSTGEKENLDKADAAEAAHFAVRFAMQHLNEIALRLKRQSEGLE